MKDKIEPLNKTARLQQLHYRARGNPPSTLPSAAISNCFPGLEYDFKNFWRRAFVGIVLLEWDNYVIEADPDHQDLVHHRLLKVGDHAVVTKVSGPIIPGGEIKELPSTSGDPSVMTMEWSNALAYAFQHQGEEVKCQFTLEESDAPQWIPDDPKKMREVALTVRTMLEGDSVVPSMGALQPGELTQGLCSPWQHDYRECACYYWPASRPDYVNVEPTPAGVSRGDNWMSRGRSGEYILDDRKDSRMVTYVELFREWEKMLQFQVKGRDAEES
jgi:hypothetical protein